MAEGPQGKCSRGQPPMFPPASPARPDRNVCSCLGPAFFTGRNITQKEKIGLEGKQFSSRGKRHPSSDGSSLKKKEKLMPRARQESRETLREYARTLRAHGWDVDPPDGEKPGGDPSSKTIREWIYGKTPRSDLTVRGYNAIMMHFDPYAPVSRLIEACEGPTGGGVEERPELLGAKNVGPTTLANLRALLEKGGWHSGDWSAPPSEKPSSEKSSSEKSSRQSRQAEPSRQSRRAQPPGKPERAVQPRASSRRKSSQRESSQRESSQRESSRRESSRRESSRRESSRPGRLR